MSDQSPPIKPPLLSDSEILSRQCPYRSSRDILGKESFDGGLVRGV